MTIKGDKITYKARIKPETVESWQRIAAALGFYVAQPGRYFGQESVGDCLDALAANETAVIAALKGIGIQGDGRPGEE